MLAAISGEDHRVSSVQVTWLDPHTGTKAEIDPPRKTFGLMFDGSVRLGPAGDELALAEGVETALSFAKLTGTTCWAVLGKARFDKITIPKCVRRLHLGADADEDSRLQCRRARCHYRNIGLDVVVHIPEFGGDFNDVLVGRRTA
jgi:putative DNA primase/helicase